MSWEYPKDEYYNEWLRGYENGRKKYGEFKARAFKSAFAPKDITESIARVIYTSGQYEGWDAAQKEDITVNE